MGIWDTILGGKRARRVAQHNRQVRAINGLEERLHGLSDAELQSLSGEIRGRARAGTSLDDLLVEAYAVVREAAQRTIGLRHYDVQLLGGMALHDGQIAEMRTGEGKTLVATLPAYLNTLGGRSVHVITVNDYLAQRDADWMEPLYRFLGLSVGVILEAMGGDEHEELRRRRAAYACDVTYGTNSEIAFDYLRDNLATDPDGIVHRSFDYVIIDEVDFVLIDEARTPLIISGSAEEETIALTRVNSVVGELREVKHFTVEPKTRTATLTELGFHRVSQQLGVDNLCRLEHIELYHLVLQSVLAHGVYELDVDYIVEHGTVRIVDEYTGRVSEDKRYSDGLHQAIEVKEGVVVQAEDQTLATVTYPMFFGRYHKLAGMTGTAWSERREFAQTYGRDVRVVPTHRPMIRRDLADRVYFTLDEKHEAIVQQILSRTSKGQPVLVGTTSVHESEVLSRRLDDAGVTHALLNAKTHEAEAAIIAEAGRASAVTISTSMAGRGTDIILGGSGSERTQERDEVVEAGGLHVIGTSHHDAKRIDDQLRGRAGRQGDCGSSQFIVSLDDDIWKKFGRDQINAIRASSEDAHPADEPIDSTRVRRILRSLQKKVDEDNQATRTDVLKYDLVVHAQRESIYAWRRTLVTAEGYDPAGILREVVDDLIASSTDRSELTACLHAHFHSPFEVVGEYGNLAEGLAEQALTLLVERESAVGEQSLHAAGRRILLKALDDLWTEHLSKLEYMEQGIGLRGYAEVDPLVAWRAEATRMWDDTLRRIRSRAVTLWFRLDLDGNDAGLR